MKAFKQLRGAWPLAPAVAAALGLPACAPALADDGAHVDWGVIEYSNGEEQAGRMSLSPGRKLRLHVGRKLVEIPLDTVRSMRIAPREESLERKWMFPEAGKTHKRVYGEPYPMRYLSADVRLTDGRAVNGHVYTTALYIETEAGTRKAVLPAKQRGKQGESLADLVYPTRLDFPNRIAERPDPTVITIADPPAGRLDMAALTRPGLSRVDVGRTGQGTFELHITPDTVLWFGLKRGHRIIVGWPPRAAAPALIEAVRTAVTDARDFFDVKQPLAVYREADSSTVYSLMLLSRRGATTLGRKRNRPWRCTVWRWKQGPDGRLMLAGQGYLFRGILEPGAELPAVDTTPALWQAGAAGNRELTWAALSPEAATEVRDEP